MNLLRVAHKESDQHLHLELLCQAAMTMHWLHQLPTTAVHKHIIIHQKSQQNIMQNLSPVMTSMGWVFDFLICSGSGYSKKNQNQRTASFKYLKIFGIKEPWGPGIWKNSDSKNRWFQVFQKVQRTAGFHERTGKDPAGFFHKAPWTKLFTTMWWMRQFIEQFGLYKDVVNTHKFQHC